MTRRRTLLCSLAVPLVLLTASPSTARDQPHPASVRVPLVTEGSFHCTITGLPGGPANLYPRSDLSVFRLALGAWGHPSSLTFSCPPQAPVALKTVYAITSASLSPAPQPAEGQEPTLEEDLSAAQADASAYWGEVPCGGDVSFAWPYKLKTERLIFGSEDIAMMSSWEDIFAYPGYDLRNQEGRAYPAQDYTQCRVRIASSYYGPEDHTPSQDWPEFCMNLGHEWEHLLDKWWVETYLDYGAAPLPASDSVAYPAYTGKNTPASCEHTPVGLMP
jgi:hypothetical protein